MSKRQTKIRFFTIADFNEEQTWLEKQHKKGWKLVKVSMPCFFTFKECEPQDVSYRLEFKNNRVSDDYLQMYEDYGWEYIDSSLGWNYFKKTVNADDVSGENEIFSDDESKLNMIDRIIKMRLIPIFVALIPALFLILRSMMTETVFGLESPRGIASIIIILLALIDIYLIVYCWTKLKKLRNNL